MRTADPELQQQRREQILLAAYTCFLAKGFHQSSMADIANASGLSMGLLYRYFKNKHALVLAFAELDRADAVQATMNLARAPSLHAGLELYLDYLLRTNLDPGYITISAEIFAESLRNSQLLAQLSAADATEHAALAQALKQLQARDLIVVQWPVEMLASLILALTDGLAARVKLEADLKRDVLKDSLLKLWLAVLSPTRV